MSHRQSFGAANVSRALRLKSMLTTASVLTLLAAGASGAAARPLGVSTTFSAPNAAVEAAMAAAQQAAAIARLSQASMLRASQAMQTFQALQNAARNAAAAGPNNLGADPNHPGALLPNVPDGLNVGGLMPDSGLAGSGVANPVKTWMNANTPVQTTSNGQTTVSIQQTASQAVLNWATFNVGKNTIVQFLQGGTDWVALNRITDPSGVPSQILGQIQAPGSVYLINQNGIIFGGTSQINVGTLIASSLWMNQSLFNNGQLNNPAGEFLFVGQGMPFANTNTASNVPADQNTDKAPSNGFNGDVTVQPGATIVATPGASGTGGRISLIGPNVTNAGSISAVEGQVILAAGLQVAFTAHASSDPSLRGLDTFVGAVGAGGTATNSGLIEVPRGDVAMVGKAIFQNGGIDSSTSVALNGRVDLLAVYDTTILPLPQNSGQQAPATFSYDPTATGTITLGAESIIRVLPETDSTDTIAATSLALPSQVNLQGNVIHLAGNAAIVAPNANVVVQAGVFAADVFESLSGQISLDAGALIDVSGSQNVAASVADNFIQVQLRAAQLADSPLQRNGPLRGATVTVDIRESGTNPDGTTWVGTPLADVSGYVGLIQHDVGQLTVNGGNVTLTAGDSVTLQPGSNINVSGGWINYQGAMVGTSRLIGADGHLYDISKASPDLVYVGVLNGFTVDHSRWNVTETFANLLGGKHFEPGYIQGGNGGTLSIQAPTIALDGSSLVGQTVTGLRQLSAPPAAGTLSLNFFEIDPAGGSRSSAPDIVFGAEANAGSNTIFLPTNLLGSSGFGSLSINDGDGSISVPVATTLVGAVGGSLELTGKNVTVDGSVVMPSGTISITTLDFSPSLIGATPSGSVDPTRGNFILGPDGSLSTAGPITGAATAALNGGNVKVQSVTINLQAGSTIDVSGGIAETAPGKFAVGSGGSISLLAGTDNGGAIQGGSLTLGSGAGGLDVNLLGYGGKTGGSLTLQSTLVQIGGSAPDPSTLVLAADFFDEGGFSNFTVNGIGAASGAGFATALRIAAGTQIAPVVTNIIGRLDGFGNIAAATVVDPIGQRAPVNLSFNALGEPQINQLAPVLGDFVMESGTAIVPDPGGHVSINSQQKTGSPQTAEIAGSIVAPGGSISISGSPTGILTGAGTDLTNVSVTIEPGAVISARGVAVIGPNPDGVVTTSAVLAGGTVSLSGNILVLAGSIIDVSGTTGVLNGFASPSVLRHVIAGENVDSDGGMININVGERLFIDQGANLLGAAGGPTAAGGALLLTATYLPGGPGSPSDITPLIVSQTSAPTAPSAFVSGFGAYVGIDHFEAGGFGTLGLNGLVNFTGPVSISASTSIVIGGTAPTFSADNSVTLAAPYVALGGSFLAPGMLSATITQAIVPTFGAGSLNVVATGLIDVGNLSLQNIGTVNLTAPDVRGDGALDVQGTITITAGQVYPVTGSKFVIAAFDYTVGASVKQSGTVTFNPFPAAGIRPLPLSAGGELDVYASVINQGGVLRAPFGIINLGFDTSPGIPAPIDALSGLPFKAAQSVTLRSGSTTSVSGIDPTTGMAIIVPYGIEQNDTSWIDPLGNNITSGGLPAKSINIFAGAIDDQAGSTVDLRGGGDLYAYRFVPGLGGSKDILSSTSTSFAILPGYGFNYAPYGAFNTTVGDPGYVSGKLAVGDQIYLNGGGGIPAGFYTLLPPRYALLPGAFLVTPQTTTVIAPGPIVAKPDGSSLVAGYRFNDPAGAGNARGPWSEFEVASGGVVRQRAEYDDFFANATLTQGALAAGQAVPRLPQDAGHLLFDATSSVAINGAVLSQTPGGLGGEIDIASSSDIVITATGANTGSYPSSDVFLSAQDITALGLDSLVIGGIRSNGPSGTNVNVTTGNVTLDNAGSPLAAADVTLVANNNLTLAAGADLEQQGTLSHPADVLVFGSTGSGSGVLVRVSSDPNARVQRDNVDTTKSANLVVGAGATLAGASVIIDSTSATSLSSSVKFGTSSRTVQALSIDSGRISLQLDSTPTNPGAGLILTSATLNALQASLQSLSLLSYSSIDIYGGGTVGGPTAQNLAFHAGEIRGFGTGTAIFTAQNIQLDNVNNSTGPGPGKDSNDSVVFNASVLTIGTGQLAIDQFAGDANNVGVTLSASNGLLGQGTGTLIVQHDLTVRTPLITGTTAPINTSDTGATAANLTLTVGGALNFDTSGTTGTITGGLGAIFSATAATISVNTDIRLASGALTLHATAGDLVVGDTNSQATLDVSGAAQAFNDVTQYTSGGSISLISDTGSVRLNGGNLFLDAQHVAPGTQTVGDAGTLSISAVLGQFIFSSAVGLSAQGGTMAASGTALGNAGSFTLDVGSLTTTAALNDLLNGASFAYSRSIRVRTGDVILDGTAQAHSFTLSADQGAITVSGTVDASGTTGGAISLAAGGDVTLVSGSLLNVHAAVFDDADKGGSVDIETLGKGSNGIEILGGSKIDLSVDAGIGGVGGTLHLRVPRTGISDANPGGTDVDIAPILGTIVNASSILVEGYKVYTPAGGSIDSVEAQAWADANSFLGQAGTDTHYSAILNRLFASNTGLERITTIAPGVEIQNPNGDLTLGGLTSTTASDWDLSSWRFGPDNVAGVLTLRASGNIVLYNSIGDGFYNPTSGPYNVTPDLLAQWGQELFSLMPAGPSWSYRFVAGADLAAADYHQVLPLSVLGDSGSFLLGKYSSTPYTEPQNGKVTSAPYFNGVSYYQVVRTGTGDINIIAGQDVQLRNPFASIYTAGEAASPIPNFDVPLTDYSFFPGNQFGRPPLGGTFSTLTPFPYPAQYSFGGGNVTITAGADISHVTLGSDNTWQEDSSLELPVNWLYRQGYVDPLTGQFGTIFNIDAYFDDISLGTTTKTSNKPPNPNAVYAEVASTSWWVNFSNFSEGVGALGGGNVKLIAGHDINNVDAVVPTNARMPKGVPNAASLVELGGGDLLVQAGGNINGGVYYVERGQGVLRAGGSIVTNSTRSTSTGASGPAPTDSTSWLGTTLFVGEGSFQVSARGDVLLGGVANPFLLPQGWGNTYWLQTDFSTYGANDSINVSSLTGNVTITGQSSGDTPGSLQAWIDNKMALSAGNTAPALLSPWTAVLGTVQSTFQAGLMPGTLRVTAFSGDINVNGSITLSPSATGTIELLAAGSLAPTPGSLKDGIQVVIDLSDANSSLIPGITNPFGLSAWPASKLLPAAFATTTISNVIALANSQASMSGLLPLTPPLDPLFDESGSTSLTLNQKQSLHAPTPVHTNDSQPAYLYAGGDISGLELFSAKAAEIVAGRDITDIAFYIQDLSSSDLTKVIAGRDILTFDPGSPLRVTSGCSLSANACATSYAGDIQLAGPGTLEVLAGRNLDLGIGPSNADGTAAGIVTIGNFANPFIPNPSGSPNDGASVVVAAGLGKLTSLDSSNIDFAAFDAQFLNPATAGGLAARYLPELGQLMNAGNLDNNGIWSAYQQLSPDQQHRLALSLFYDVLRDSGRDHNDPNAVNGTRNYEIGFQAIGALLPGNTWQGDISLTSREIKTLSGGNINILAPGGALNVGFDLGQNQPIDQGILTVDGGNINIFARDSVNVGTSRIFTLNGGNEIIWSSTGNIAAGAASKTLRVAVPVRVQVDPTTMNVETDLAGLATGGGIGVLQVRPSAPVGDVDLIAPAGFVDAGDAGIRVSGNLNIAAVQVLNASNIQVGGASTGVPTVQPPPVAALASASNTAGASQKPAAPEQPTGSDRPSIIIVEFLGFGGGSGEPSNQDDDRRKRDNQQGMRQDSNSAVQVLGAGSLSEHAQQYLTAEEKAKLNNH